LAIALTRSPPDVPAGARDDVLTLTLPQTEPDVTIPAVELFLK